MTDVRKAVIPAAGLGTRFLPATKAQAKEMLPVVDKPGIQYVVEEAVRAGLDEILIITTRGKASLEDHFDRSLELEHHLEASGKDDALREIRRIAELADIHYVRQKEPLGFGHAVLAAKAFASGQPFVVMVGDEIVPDPGEGEASLLGDMVDHFRERGSSVVAVQEVPPDEISSYGAIDPEPLAEGLVRVRDMVEKPPASEAPSNLAARGRYLFTADIFDAIERTEPGVGGEIQLTDAIKILAREKEVLAYVFGGTILDVGKPLDYLRATVELALLRDDLAKPFREFLVELLDKQE